MLHLAPGAAIPHRALARHIGVFGATGTGKTTSAAALIERAPCPALVLDAKGDLEALGDSVSLPALRVDALGPDYLSRALDLSPAQSGALTIALHWAEDTGRAVVSLGDLRTLLTDMLGADLSGYGLVSAQSVAAVQRAMLRLERAAPWIWTDSPTDYRDTQGLHVVSCRHVADIPGLYGAYAAHVLDSLYRGLAELGDVAPGLIVMIDEAHLLFGDAPVALTRRLEQVTRLIRSRGVGLIYVTQSPADLPEAITAQLSTRIQHGLRGATPRQQASIRAAADTMPGNVTAADIAALGVGQAIVSIPNSKGVPLPAQRVTITPGRRATGTVDVALPETVNPVDPAEVAINVAPPKRPDPPPFALLVLCVVALLMLCLQALP